MKALLITGLYLVTSCAPEYVEVEDVLAPNEFEEDFDANMQFEQPQKKEQVQASSVPPAAAPITPRELIPTKASLWWIGYDFQRENRLVNVEIVTKGAPQYDLLHEKNLKNQPELIVRFFDTSVRSKIRRDIDASEFPSPVSYIRTRQNSDGTADVILTLRQAATPQLFAKEGNLLLSFDIPESYLGGKREQGVEVPFTILSVAQENFQEVDETLQLDDENLNLDNQALNQQVQNQNQQINENLNLDLQEERSQQEAPSKPAPEAIEVTGKDQDVDEEQSAFQPISIEFKGASLREVIRALSAENQVNFIIPDSISTKKIYLKLQDVPWDEALQAIMETHSLGMVKLRGDVVRIDSLSVLEHEKQDIEQVRKRAALVTPTKVLVVRLSYAKAKDMVTIIRTMLPSAEFDKRVKVEADDRTNSIIVEAIPQELSKVRALIERVDLQTPQVKIETRVIEVLKDVKKFFGINWGGPFLFDQGRGLGFGTLVFPNNLMSAFSVDTGAGDHQNGGRFDVNIGSLNNSTALSLRLRMSELSNNTRSLQNSSIIVLDHETASIEAGQEDYFQIPTGEGQTAMSSVKYALSLQVTPHITADGSVQMKVTIENSAPKTTTNAQASTSKSMRTLTTNLLRQSGETAVIGGLYTTLLKKTKQGLPILSDIPFIGALFRSYNHEEDKRELIIMVTPTILASAQLMPSDKLIPSPEMGKTANLFEKQAKLNADQTIDESLQIQSQQVQSEGQ
ncbi:MAG: hypothetical protein HYW48_10175 [Deltaproteobacteria bacterium]|nr:hypothetical protein [Deltaproteobacteria bacterium]